MRLGERGSASASPVSAARAETGRGGEEWAVCTAPPNVRLLGAATGGGVFGRAAPQAAPPLKLPRFRPRLQNMGAGREAVRGGLALTAFSRRRPPCSEGERSRESGALLSASL